MSSSLMLPENSDGRAMVQIALAIHTTPEMPVSARRARELEDLLKQLGRERPLPVASHDLQKDAKLFRE